MGDTEKYNLLPNGDRSFFLFLILKKNESVVAPLIRLVNERTRTLAK